VIAYDPQNYGVGKQQVFVWDLISGFKPETAVFHFNLALRG
jgi:hypothetical protein